MINEVESSGGSPGDWVELMNVGTSTINVSGWIFRDNDNGHTYTIPSGQAIPVGGYLVLNEAQFGFGLGAPDSARLFNASGTLIDSYVWSSHASTSYGRCPNGTGALTTTNASSKGSANLCPLPMEGWPGDSTVSVSDGSNQFGSNLSGLTYEASPGFLWAVQNNNAAGSLTQGKFVARVGFNRPSGMANLNNEGIAIMPESECSGGTKRFVWSDDGNTSGHALRDGRILCGPLD